MIHFRAIVLRVSKYGIPLFHLVKFINFVLVSVTSMFMWRMLSAQTEPMSAEMYGVAGGQNRVFKFILWLGADF